MRRTTLLALIAAAAVAGWILLFEMEAPAPEGPEPVFGLEAAEVLAIEIERPGEPPVRVAREGDGFTVAEGDAPAAPADRTEVDLLLQNAESLGFERELPEGAAGDPAAFGLDPPGLVVRVSTEAGTSAAGFGDETAAPGNRYLGFGEGVLVVPAFARANFEKNAWDLRDRRVFRHESAAALGLRLTADGRTVELARDGADWTVVRPFRFAADRFEASQLAAGLLDLEMAGLAPPPGGPGGPDPFGLETPRLAAELDLSVGPEETPMRAAIRFGGESEAPPGIFAATVDSEVFVVDEAFVERLAASVVQDLEAVRSLRLFRFAAFRAVELRVAGPDREAVFRRRDGGEGREWTVGEAGAEPVVADSAKVEDLLYELNSADADGVGAERLPAGAALWTIAVAEEGETEGQPPVSGPETVRIAVLETGEVRALRDGDERTLTLNPEAWEEISEMLAAARTPS